MPLVGLTERFFAMNPGARMPSLFVPHGGGPAFMEGEMHPVFEPMREFLAGVHATLPARPRGCRWW